MMTHASLATITNIEPKERLIIALDVTSAAEARSLVSELRGEVGAFKIGLQLFTAVGPQFVRELVDLGERVFLDLKFHDIPNTVANAAVESARLGVWMLNVHACGGIEMLERTVADVHSACENESLNIPKLMAVTVLTSSNADDLRVVGVDRDLEAQVSALARLSADAGMDGVVASPHEVGAIRNVVDNKDFLIVTPGIRPVSATNDDQKRVTTFARAIGNGSDYVVVGRPITKAPDRLKAVHELLAEAISG